MATLYSISSANKASVEYPAGFWEQGFRPFFFGAALFSVVAMLLWLMIYSQRLSFAVPGISSMQWHAHQMIFGYCFAVVAGFLLTAVPNWTTTRMVSGFRLVSVFGCWAIARLSSLFGTEYVLLSLVFDTFFGCLLFYFIAEPVYKTKSWQQTGILSKVLLLLICNLGVYLNILNLNQTGAVWGIYGGLYLIIGLILTVSARVYPNFVRIGVGAHIGINEPKWLSICGIVLFLLFFINELVFKQASMTSGLAAVLFILYGYRLFIWHTAGIWKKVLLWSLYLSVLFIDLGFLFIALQPFFGISKFIAVHLMAVGGIGFATLGFMARVSLGHSGQSVHNPTACFIWVLRLLLVALFFRVVMPLLDPIAYTDWIMFAQIAWILAFAGFMLLFRRQFFRSD